MLKYPLHAPKNQLRKPNQPSHPWKSPFATRRMARDDCFVRITPQGVRLAKKLRKRAMHAIFERARRKGLTA